MAADNRRAPYSGPTRKLIISIDVGTTFTATSFCLLQPGNVPKFEEILRWPKQATPDAKVPSVLYYDKHGTARAFGAETDDEDTIMEAEENGWTRVEWWKLLLRPAHLPIIKDLVLPPLPHNVTVDKIFADHLRYIKDQAYISSTYGSGGDIWDVLSQTMYVILTTPNGWEGSQQNRMRQAAINAGLVDQDGGRRVRFVTEAEAAVLYAADSGSVEDWLVEDGHLILCDCGGGTVDITGYKINAVKPALKLEESSASRCYLAGAVFVTQAAKAFFRGELQTTLHRLVYREQNGTTKSVCNALLIISTEMLKKKFAEGDTACYVQVEGHKTIPNLGITRGRLKLTGAEMESFFQAPLKQIQEGLEIAFENGGRLADASFSHSKMKVILVGGLASSPYVFSKLVAWGKEFGISVSRPDGPTTKAVANGALAWHLDSSVGARIAKYHYGISIKVPFKPDNPEHSGRPTFTDLAGVKCISGGWSSIVKKAGDIPQLSLLSVNVKQNEKIEISKEFSSTFLVDMEANRTDFKYRTTVYAYRRLAPPPFLQFPGKQTLVPGYDVVCTVEGDLTNCYAATPYKTMNGVRFKEVEASTFLGETEITARLRWEEDGEDVYGPATIAYD
ncbi:hypothetical protein MSAN_01170300 [Mycena sanguinolenta]|uniref:Actin-like ATPase domain-containing protein n=1 Tax=Mycena sanguinolenta TaxID=230812 RepID=A0A8H7D4Q2_9AGAR|nr:hypothetical protein MSAN_01170300 [Mycena sanguinolenta]